MTPQISQNEQVFKVIYRPLKLQNTPKSRPFGAENKAQTLPTQVQNNYEKVQKSTFLTPKMVKNDPSNRPK